MTVRALDTLRSSRDRGFAQQVRVT